MQATCQAASVEARGQCVGSWGSNSGPQAWQQAPLLSEPSRQPLSQLTLGFANKPGSDLQFVASKRMTVLFLLLVL